MNNQTDTQDTVRRNEPYETLWHLIFAWRACKNTDKQLAAALDVDEEVDRLIGGRTLRAGQSEPVARHVTDEMVSRFLWWKLPADFDPDCGITFKRVYNEASAFGPQTREPVGTNLLSADQARAMLEHVLGGAGQSPTASPPEEALWIALRELVAMKDLKNRIADMDQHRSTDAYREFKAMVAEYDRRKPLAWEAARAALRSTLPQTTGGKGS